MTDTPMEDGKLYEADSISFSPGAGFVAHSSKPFQHTFAGGVQEEFEVNGARGWRPSIALPLYVGFGLKKCQCACGRKFKNEEDYKAHYIYMAVWQNESNYIPSLLGEAPLYD